MSIDELWQDKMENDPAFRDRYEKSVGQADTMEARDDNSKKN